MPYYQPGDIVLRDYKIEAFIGEGGFGEVYRARDLHLREQIALKILRHTSSIDDAYYERAKQRFTLEALLGHHTNHPNVIRIYKFAPDETSGLLALVMEYAPGGSLVDRMKSGPMAVEDALQIARQVAAGLSALHAQDIVHRDLKPSNILFDATGSARVADLGLAQAATAMLQITEVSTGAGGEFHSSPGTPAYMSPEQESGRPHLPPASDIYTLGLILFEMLTGRSYKNQPPGTCARQLRLDVPQQLDDLLLTLLSEDPRQRPWNGTKAETALVALAITTPAAPTSIQPPQTGRHLEEGLAALDEMMQAEEWELADETLAEMENEFPGNFRLKLPRKKITQALVAVQARRAADVRARQEAEEKARQEAARRPGYLRREDERIFLRLDKNQEMAFLPIPAGEFLMGSDPEKDTQLLPREKPQHRIILPEYWLGRAPVTNAQFAAFVQASKHRTAAEIEGYGWIWDGQKGEWVKIDGANWQQPHGPHSGLAQKDDHPVVQVSWDDAVAFCIWLSKLTGQKVSLPTEAEWEKAARGTDGRIHPWGDQPADAGRCNFNMHVKDTTPVGQYSPLGDSPYGCVDMAGNVWEWCADWYAEDYYAQSPQANPVGPATGQYRVLRGGSWNIVTGLVRAAVRFGGAPVYRGYDQGFRCRLSPL